MSSVAPSQRQTREFALIVLPLFALGVVSILGSAVMPLLGVVSPLALIAMAPRFSYMLLYAGVTDPTAYFIVCVSRMFAPDPFNYLLGRRYGEAGVRWVEKRTGQGTSRFLAYLMGLPKAAVLPALFLFPGVTCSALAGFSRISPVAFTVANVGGTMIWVTVFRFFGEEFSTLFAWVRRFIEQHVIALTVASLLSMLLFVYIWRKRQPDDLLADSLRSPLPEATEGARDE